MKRVGRFVVFEHDRFRRIRLRADEAFTESGQKRIVRIAVNQFGLMRIKPEGEYLQVVCRLSASWRGLGQLLR